MMTFTDQECETIRRALVIARTEYEDTATDALANGEESIAASADRSARRVTKLIADILANQTAAKTEA